MRGFSVSSVCRVSLVQICFDRYYCFPVIKYMLCKSLTGTKRNLSRLLSRLWRNFSKNVASPIFFELDGGRWWRSILQNITEGDACSWSAHRAWQLTRTVHQGALLKQETDNIFSGHI